MFFLLLRRRAQSAANALRSLTAYERARNAAFGLAGLGLLFGLHVGFHRLLKYLYAVEIVGPLLLWKLTAMLFLMTLSMVVVSSLLTSMTTSDPAPAESATGTGRTDPGRRFPLMGEKATGTTVFPNSSRPPSVRSRSRIVIVPGVLL